MSSTAFAAFAAPPQSSCPNRGKMAQLRGMFDPPSDEEEPTPGGATRPPLGSMFDAPPDETSIAAGGGTSATLAMSGRRQQQPPSLATMFDAPPTHDGTGTKAAGGLGGSGVDGAPTRPAASEKSSLLETAERRQQGYSKPGSRESQALSRQDTLGASHSAAGGSGLENMQLGSMDQADGDDPAVGVRRRASTRFGAGWLLLNDTYIPESWDEEKVRSPPPSTPLHRHDGRHQLSALTLCSHPHRSCSCSLAHQAQDDASADEASVVRTLTCFQRISRQLTMQVLRGALATGRARYLLPPLHRHRLTVHHPTTPPPHHATNPISHPPPTHILPPCRWCRACWLSWCVPLWSSRSPRPCALIPGSCRTSASPFR